MLRATVAEYHGVLDSRGGTARARAMRRLRPAQPATPSVRRLCAAAYASGPRAVRGRGGMLTRGRGVGGSCR